MGSTGRTHADALARSTKYPLNEKPLIYCRRRLESALPVVPSAVYATRVIFVSCCAGTTRSNSSTVRRCRGRAEPSRAHAPDAPRATAPGRIGQQALRAASSARALEWTTDSRVMRQEQLDDVLEIPGVGAEQNRRSVTGRFDHVLPAAIRQAAADEGDRASPQHVEDNSPRVSRRRIGGLCAASGRFGSRQGRQGDGETREQLRRKSESLKSR